jgi:hypothetical protein
MKKIRELEAMQARGPVEGSGVAWYGLKEGFVMSRGFATRDELDSWNTALVKECGIGADFLSVGPNPLNADAEKAPNERINDVAYAWGDAPSLRAYLQDVQFDKQRGLKQGLRVDFEKQKHYRLTVAEELLIQRISELTRSVLMVQASF